MGPGVRKSRPHYQSSPLSSRIRPYRSSALITPRSSPNTMITTTNAVNTQIKITTGENIFNQGSDMQSCQQDWHALMQTPPTIARIRAAEGAAVTKSGEILDNHSKNWSAWSQSMALLFKLFKVQDYVQGKVTCPDPNDDPEGAENWGYVTFLVLYDYLFFYHVTFPFYLLTLPNHFLSPDSYLGHQCASTVIVLFSDLS